MAQKITPCLWYNGNAQEAVDFYAGIFDDVKITASDRYTDAGPMPEGTLMFLEFTMNGLDFQAINAGPEFSFNEAISLSIDCKDQTEVDYFWEKLGEGGEYGPCGWLKDKFGLSWQVVPRRLHELTRDPNKKKAAAAMNAMLQMGKLDVAELETAFNNA
jgi:predicted 3-demethylubiquinone-9 3-methyltransferase (glyoxalase superfamily)